MVRKRDDLMARQACLCGVDISEAAKLTSTHVAQIRACRYGHAEGGEIGWRYVKVVCDVLIAEGPPEISHFQRDVAHQFVLQRRGVFPVVGPLSPALA